MKISQKLPQFKEEQALIALIGNREGRFYLAHDGIIEELRSFVFDGLKYPDSQDYFVEENGTRTIRTNAIWDPKKKRMKIELLDQLKDNLKWILTRNKIDSIYLICPKDLKNRIKDEIPDSAAKKLKLLLVGDYYHILHPFTLLQKIGENS